MKLIFILMIVVTFSIPVYSQQVNSCGYKIPPRTSSLRSNFQSVYEASSIVKSILDSVKWRENFQLQEQNGINNAYATVIRNVRWIVYDNIFLESVDSYAGTKWASISILAHEMGHHYYNHVVSSKGSTIPTEIEADAFSGYALYKFGATLEQSIAAMQAIASEKSSSTHPAKKDRLNAITSGWQKAKAEGKGAPPPPPGKVPLPGGVTPPAGTGAGNSNAENDPSWIALSIVSNKEETVYLSDDGRNFQPVKISASQPFVFKFEIYNYGWLRLPYFNGYRNYKLLHGKDYIILWNRRSRNWTITEIPD